MPGRIIATWSSFLLRSPPAARHSLPQEPVERVDSNHPATVGDNRRKHPVFVRLGEPVQVPQQIRRIPSRVRLQRPNVVENLGGDLLANLLGSQFELVCT